MDGAHNRPAMAMPPTVGRGQWNCVAGYSTKMFFSGRFADPELLSKVFDVWSGKCALLERALRSRSHILRCRGATSVLASRPAFPGLDCGVLHFCHATAQPTPWINSSTSVQLRFYVFTDNIAICDLA